MSHSKKTYESIRQNGEIVKKSQKYDASLRKNTTLYFQVGLIVCLLAAYGLLEMKFETTIPIDCGARFYEDGLAEISIERFKVYEELKVETRTLEKKVILFEDPIIVDNDHILKEVLDIHTPEQNTFSDKPVDLGSMRVLKEPAEVLVDFINVEQVPIYPGCENKKTNNEKRKCMSDKITQLIQKKFNTNLGSELGLYGKQVIRTQFKIDKTGHVSDIQVRGPHPELEKEAERVINIIPEMTPGKQRDKNVSVIYSLPIVFQVE